MLTQLRTWLFPEKKKTNLSRAQIALLAQFKSAKTLKVSGWNDAWRALLKEEPQTELKRFIRNGLINEASAEEHAYYLTIQDLKSILKQQGLPISGKKAILVERVLSSGFDIFKKFPDNHLWRCSNEGLSFVTPYLIAEDQRKQEAIQQAKAALSRDDMKTAALIAAEYRANDLFGSISLSTSLYINVFAEDQAKEFTTSVEKAPSVESRANDILKMLLVYQEMKLQRPKPFKNIPNDIFDEALNSVIWSCLGLGKRERSKEAERTGLEIWGWYSNMKRLAQYKESERNGVITGVEILCGDAASCQVGAAEKGIIYAVSDAPELPLLGCTREPCCACTYIAKVKDFF